MFQVLKIYLTFKNQSGLGEMVFRWNTILDSNGALVDAKRVQSIKDLNFIKIFYYKIQYAEKGKYTGLVTRIKSFKSWKKCNNLQRG